VYLVTIKMPGYCLFSMTPSERAAIALADDQQRVHLLERQGDDWTVRHDWPVSEHSHTDLMRRLADVTEPATIDEFVRTATGQ
jgi:hypothetical protein